MLAFSGLLSFFLMRTSILGNTCCRVLNVLAPFGVLDVHSEAKSQAKYDDQNCCDHRDNDVL